jgi:hypothetical protein
VLRKRPLLRLLQAQMHTCINIISPLGELFALRSDLFLGQGTIEKIKRFLSATWPGAGSTAPEFNHNKVKY